MPPGATSFSVVPTSALSTEANVTRVTAPGFKQCESQDDSAGDGLQLDGVNPAYDLVDLRPQGFEPQVTGLEWDLEVLGERATAREAEIGEQIADSSEVGELVTGLEEQYDALAGAARRDADGGPTGDRRLII